MIFWLEKVFTCALISFKGVINVSVLLKDGNL